MKTLTSSIIALALLFSISACQKNGENADINSKKVFSSIQKTEKFERIKPSSQLAIGCQSNTFAVEKGAEINFESGAKVKVPANAFVDQNGNPVSGSVTLEFTEINDPAAVIASGLPMCIAINGKTEYMQSGGMFEINAKQGNELLKLANGKQIDVQTKSSKEGDFNFYEYDQANGKWVEQNKSELNAVAVQNTTVATTDKAKTIDTKMPIKPQKVSKSDFVFDLKVDNFETLGISDAGNMLWTFENNKEVEANKWLFAEKWETVFITSVDPEKGLCQLEVSKGSTKKQTNVKPVLFGKDYAAALAQYNAAQQKYKQEILRREQSAELKASQNTTFMRAVSIRNMGVYNWDRIIKQPDAVVLNAIFKYEGVQTASAPVIYSLNCETNEVITFYGGNFVFQRSQNTVLLSIMPTGEVATLKTKTIKLEDIYLAREKGKIELFLKPSGQYADSAEKLGSIIKTLSVG
ncbi:MAG: hypothetical protein H6607_03505 [Flavobacteriales bacterium]|nr:hypothetical protein [Flavobacteriales bacterium]